MDPYFSAFVRDEWMKIAKKRETDLAGFRTLEEQINLVRFAGLEITNIVPFLFERQLGEWLQDAPARTRDELRKMVSELPTCVREELHFTPKSSGACKDGEPEWFFYYNVFEMVAVKKV